MVDLHCMDLGGQTGISRYTFELATALEGIGEPVRRLVIRRRELRLFGRSFGGHTLVQLQNLWKPLWKRDILHTTHLYAAHLRADVVTVHDCFPEQHAAEYQTTEVELRWFRRIVNKLEQRKVHYVTHTNAVKTAFVELHGIDPDRVHVTYDGVDPRFRPRQPTESRHPAFAGSAFNVLCVGDPHPRKRFDWVYTAVAAVREPAMRVVRVGGTGANRPAWNVQARREELAGNVLGDRLVRLGRIPEEELAWAYRSADLVVAPSLDEGLGFPPLEGLRSGIPAAVTDIPVFREVLGSHATYFRGPEDLGEVLAKASARGPPSDEVRRLNHAFVRDTYTWERTARRTLHAYQIVRETGKP